MIERIYITIMCCVSGFMLCLWMALLVFVTLCTEPRPNDRPSP